MQLMNQTGLVGQPDPVTQPASQMIRELVGNNPRLEGMNPYHALNQLLESYQPTAPMIMGVGQNRAFASISPEKIQGQYAPTAMTK